ncbi:MAG: hypothetical protein IKB70_08785 [Bacilli bacterium]|nr:hypothetical protein [Bacilli bacterium]
MDEDSKKISDEEQKAFIKALIKSFSDVPINELTAEYIQQSLCCTKETAVILLAHVMHSRGQLREEVKDLVARNVHSLEEICSVCKTMDELDDVIKFSRLVHGDKDKGDPEEELSNEWKKIAYETFKDVPIAELRTAQVQVKLKVGYSLAVRIIDWLKTVM